MGITDNGHIMGVMGGKCAVMGTARSGCLLENKAVLNHQSGSGGHWRGSEWWTDGAMCYVGEAV